MRIIGGKDYYDSARAYGQDDDVVFVRQKDSTDLYRKVSIPTYGLLPYSCGQSGSSWLAYSVADDFLAVVNVVVAGVMYTGIKCMRDGQSFVAWNAQQVIDFTEQVDRPLWFTKASAGKYRNEGIKDFYSMFRPCSLSETTMDTIINERIVIAIRDGSEKPRENHWKVNTDGLHKYNFAKVVDPYQAFQEISMWVGGVLSRPANPIVELKNEKIMLAKHSMDKWSFRKPSENRKDR